MLRGLSSPRSSSNSARGAGRLVVIPGVRSRNQTAGSPCGAGLSVVGPGASATIRSLCMSVRQQGGGVSPPIRRRARLEAVRSRERIALKRAVLTLPTTAFRTSTSTRST